MKMAKKSQTKKNELVAYKTIITIQYNVMRYDNNNGFTSVTFVHEKTWNKSLVLQIWSRKRVKERNKT